MSGVNVREFKRVLLKPHLELYGHRRNAEFCSRHVRNDFTNYIIKSLVMIL